MPKEKSEKKGILKNLMGKVKQKKQIIEGKIYTAGGFSKWASESVNKKIEGVSKKTEGISKGIFQKKCTNPRCGFIGETDNNICERCGSALVTVRKPWRAGPIGYSISFITYLAIIELLIFMGPLSSLLNLVSVPIQQGLNMYAPGWTGLAYLPQIVAGILGILLALLLNKIGLFWGSVTIISLVAIFGFGPALLAAIPSPGGPLGGYWRFLGCLGGGGNYLVCEGLLQTTPTVKEERVRTVEFNFGTEWSTPPYTLAPIPAKTAEVLGENKTVLYDYKFSVEVYNPNEEMNITDFYINSEASGIQKRSAKIEDEELAPRIEPDSCTIQDPCDLEPFQRETLTMSFSGGKTSEGLYETDISAGEDYARINVKTAYSMSGIGKNEFVLVKSEKEQRIAPTPRPEASPGPVTITTWFSPDRITLDQKSRDITLMVDMMNRIEESSTIKESKVRVDKIHVDVMEGYEKYITFTDECRIKDETFSAGKEETVTLEPFETRQSFYCKFKVNDDVEIDDYKSIPFKVKVDYNLINIFSQDVLLGI